MAITTTKNGSNDAAARLNSTIDCADLALRLGMEQPGGKGNFKSPHREDKNPSVTMYAASAGKNSRWWDHTDGIGGGALDLLMWHGNLDFVPALKALAEMYGVRLERPRADAPAQAQQQSLVEYIADKCLQAVRSEDGRAEVLNYLEGRGISRKVIEGALAKRTLGLNTYCNSKAHGLGEVGYGGPAAAFIVRSQNSSAVVALELRYIEPTTNGGQKSGSQGEKRDFPWTSDWRRLQEARTVYVVESCINALSIETCAMPGTAALATRGTGNVENIDWSFLRGKQVIACFDNDKPRLDGPNAG